MTSTGPVTIIEELGPHFIELFNPYDETIDIGGWSMKGGMIVAPSLNLSAHNQQSQEILDETDKENQADQSGLIKFWKSLTIKHN